MKAFTGLLAVVLLILGVAAAGAQTFTGSITGKVVDEQGGGMPGATVTLTGKTGARTTVTDLGALPVLCRSKATTARAICCATVESAFIIGFIPGGGGRPAVKSDFSIGFAPCRGDRLVSRRRKKPAWLHPSRDSAKPAYS